MKSKHVVVAVVAFVGFWLLRMGLGSDWSGPLQGLALVTGLALFVGSTCWLMQGYQRGQDEVVVQNPTLAHFLFDSTRSAPLWLGARVYLGDEWFQGAGTRSPTLPGCPAPASSRIGSVPWRCRSKAAR